MKLTLNQAIFKSQYRLSDYEKKVVKEKVKELLEAGLVRESTSPYNTPFFPVRKQGDEKGKKSRLVEDLPSINAVTVKEDFPIPEIDER